MHVRDQKVTLVKIHPQFSFVIVTLQSCAVVSPSSHTLFPTRELALLSLICVHIHEFSCLI